MARQDREFVNQVMRDFRNQKLKSRIHVLKLPCSCNVRVDISRPVDQPVKCPVCGQGWYYVHSQRGLFRK